MTELLTAPALTDVLLRRELVEAGHTDRAIARLVSDGSLVKLRHGAYAAATSWAAADQAGRTRLVTRAVLRQARAELVVSHGSAMAEHDGPMWGLPDDATHVTRIDGHAGRREAGVVQHQGLLLPGDVVERDGVRVTSGVRTAIDVTTQVGVEAALVAVNHLLHTGRATQEQLRARYATMEHHPGTLTTDVVLRLADPRIESVGESRTFYLLWRQGLPRPEPQVWVLDRQGAAFARVDFAWPERKRWLEFDGRQKFVKFLRDGETVTDAVLREKRREEIIAELTGWRCLRITWADLADPVRLAARIRAFLA